LKNQKYTKNCKLQIEVRNWSVKLNIID